jgi:hypothetical protein
MPVSAIERRKGVLTQEAVSHHVFASAHKLTYPFEVLSWNEPEFNLELVQEVKNAAVKWLKIFARYPYKISDLFVANSRRCSRATSF